MEQTVTLTPEQMKALKSAFPDMAIEEAFALLFSKGLNRRCRIHLKRARLLTFQSLKRTTP